MTNFNNIQLLSFVAVLQFFFFRSCFCALIRLFSQLNCFTFVMIGPFKADYVECALHIVKAVQ